MAEAVVEVTGFAGGASETVALVEAEELAAALFDVALTVVVVAVIKIADAAADAAETVFYRIVVVNISATPKVLSRCLAETSSCRHDEGVPLR